MQNRNHGRVLIRLKILRDLELSTGSTEDMTDEMTTLTESTFPVSTTDKSGSTEVTTTGETEPYTVICCVCGLFTCLSLK